MMLRHVKGTSQTHPGNRGKGRPGLGGYFVRT